VVDVLLVSLGSTGGLRVADEALADGLRRAGLSVEVVRAARPREVRTFALTDLVWALAARRAAQAGIARHEPRVVIYSSVGAALLWPRPGVIRYDALMADNRPGRHGLWQRPVERRRLQQALLLLPWTELPPPVEPGARPPVRRDVDVVAYGANPEKKGLDRVLAAWRAARRDGETLVVAGLEGRDEEGVRYAGLLPSNEMGALLARGRVFCCAPRREDFGLVQLEALAAGCALVTTEAPGPYAALPLARALDPRLVGDNLAGALRTALDDPLPGYADRARELLAPFTPEAVDAALRERVLPALALAGERGA
jgi:glycosyltransferase involved in cell wall biosynthesis